MMKKKLVILFIFILSLFCGCSCHRVYKPLKKSEIISYVKQKKRNGDKLTVKIVSEKQLKLERGCTSCISLDLFEGIVVGGHEYELEIIDENGHIVELCTYTDGYYYNDEVRDANLFCRRY